VKTELKKSKKQMLQKIGEGEIVGKPVKKNENRAGPYKGQP
jgi:hypothetical protein